MINIDGRKIAKKIEDDIAKKVLELISLGKRRPSLAIILVGGREDSKLYVSLKEKTARTVGVDTSLYLIDESEGEDSIIKTIEFLNNDESVDGILLQLPLPQKFNTNKILPLIKKEKDVDGFNISNDKIFLSPVALAIKYSLEESKANLYDKKAFLFFNSEIFKNEINDFLKSLGVNLADSISQNNLEKILNGKNNQTDLQELQKKVKSVEIIISAMGRPEFIDKNFLQDNQIIIDIGIFKKDKKVLGDLKFSDTLDFKGYITPVPGGIGPITVACLLKNVLQSFLNKN